MFYSFILISFFRISVYLIFLGKMASMCLYISVCYFLYFNIGACGLDLLCRNNAINWSSYFYISKPFKYFHNINLIFVRKKCYWNLLVFLYFWLYKCSINFLFTLFCSGNKRFGLRLNIIKMDR